MAVYTPPELDQIMHCIQLTSCRGILKLYAEASFSDEFILVSGENGAGKTTLLRCIAGLEQARGQVIFNGQVWMDSSAGFVLAVEARHIGCVWADAALLPWLNAERNITLGSNQVDKECLSRLTEQLEITSLMQRKPHMLSTGEAQRVSLARAIYRKPSILLLDEPFAAQAPTIRKRLRICLKSVQSELQIPVIMVSHDVEDANMLADQHWHMREGRLLTEVMELSANMEARA